MRKLTLDAARKRTEERGFRFLSPSYEGAMTKHRFACQKGHEWEATPDRVWRGDGCPRCAEDALRFTLSQAIERTEKRGFRFLSPTYEGNKIRRLFRCGEGHEWEARPSHVWRGAGCPLCSEWKSERTVREILEEDFALPTEKARPAWLRHKKGKPLELDGYHPGLRFAWEHQGPQHFGFDPHFHRGDEKAFLAQQKRDAFKRERVALQGVLLFEIPQTKPATREGILAAIEREAERCCLPFPFNPAFREMMAQAGLPM